MQNEKIFKFAMVRAPELNSGKPIGFSTFSDSGERTPFMDTLTSLRTQEGGDFLAKQESQTFLASSGVRYIKNDPELAQIASILEWLELGTFVSTQMSDLELEVTNLLGSSPSAFLVSPEYTESKEKLWNSYIASIIDDSSHHSYRETGLSGIRVLRLIELVAAPPAGLSAQDAIKNAMTNTPIIPEGLLRGLIPFPEELSEDATFQPLSQIQQDAILKFSNMEAAIEEITSSQESRLEQLRQEAQSESQNLSSILDDPGQRPSFPANSDPTTLTMDVSRESNTVGFFDPYRFEQSVVDSFSTTTQELLNEYEIDLTKMYSFESIPILESRMNEVVYSAFRSKAIEVVHLSSGSISQSSVSIPENFDLQMEVPESLKVIAQRAAEENHAFTYQSPQIPQGDLAPGVRILGIADLKLVRQSLQKYELGEISHIQNVMKTEKRERTHRRFQQNEEEIIVTTELSEENERSLTTSDRFQLQKEAESTIQEDSRLQVGASVSAQYGPVKATANVGYATSNSKSSAERSSSTYARDVTDRSVEKITKKATESRRSRSLREVEDTNLHSFDNKTGTSHVTGIYRWVDKIYEAQIYNYGKRLMLEFIVPEPSILYLHSLQNRRVEGKSIEKPASIGGLTPSDLQSYNYMTWVQRYSVEGVKAPPPEYMTVGTSISKQFDGNTESKSEEGVGLTIDDGYIARLALCHYSGSLESSRAGACLNILVGTTHEMGIAYDSGGNQIYNRYSAWLRGNEDTLGVSIHSQRYSSYSVNIDVVCHRKPETLAQWQLETFGKIVQAYEQKKSEYEEKLESFMLEDNEFEIPDLGEKRNFEIIKNELKRNCISMMTNRVSESFSSHSGRSSDGFPQLNFQRAESEGKIIQHFEGAFEWEQMTYEIYPYFWGHKGGWMEKMSLSHPDEQFQSFLQSGAARIVLPVHPSYTDAVLHYLQNGTLWQGGESPVIEDELFVSIAEEMKQTVDPNGVPEGNPWELRIPTKLVILQDATDSTLPDWTLP